MRRSCSSPPRAAHTRTRALANEDLVNITEPDYDETISHHPKATLKYLDDDDGELVTVGTSLELSQRLQEPVMQGVDAPQAHHIFDIDREQDTVQAWQSIVDRPNDGTSRSEDDGKDFQKMYIRACNPPKLQKVGEDTHARSSTWGNVGKLDRAALNRKKAMGAANTTKVDSHLTEEGRRQAEAAGARMRAMPSCVSAIPGSPSYQNRWASYNRSDVPFTLLEATSPLRASNNRSEAAFLMGDGTSSTESVVGGNSQLSTGRKGVEQHIKVNKTNPSKSRYPLTVRLPTVQFSENASSSAKASSTKVEKGSDNGSMDLLQVFESVFDQTSDEVPGRDVDTKDLAAVATDSTKTNFSPPTTNEATYDDVPHVKDAVNIDASQAPSPIECIGQSIKRSVEKVVLAVRELQKLPSPHETKHISPAAIAQTLEAALSDSLTSFDTCLEKIARSAEAASGSSKEARSTLSDTISECSWDAVVGASSSDSTIPTEGRRLDLQDEPRSQNDNVMQHTAGSLQAQPSSTADPSDPDTFLDDMLGSINLSEDDATTYAHSSGAGWPGKPRVSLPKETFTDPLSAYATGANDRSPVPASEAYPGNLTRPVATISHADLASHRLPRVGSAYTNANSRICPALQELSPAEHYTKNPATAAVPAFPPLPSMVPLLPSSPMPGHETNFDPSSVPQLCTNNFPVPRGPSGAPGAANGDSDALQDYQIHLMLLEQQNKKRLLMARQEQDTVGRPEGHQMAAQSERSPGSHPFVSPSDETRGSQPSHAPHGLHKHRPRGIESSGQFFNRMTGLDAGAAQFDAYMESTSNPGPRARAEALRRSATVAGLNGRFTNFNRRPYSTNFDGRGRMPWDSFLRPEPTRAQRPLPRTQRVPTSRWNATRDAAPTFSMPGAFPNNEPINTESVEDPTLEKARACAKQLRDLGFGSDSDDGTQRLMVYAQAAEGVLVDAIDMIDEEQKAHERRYLV